MHACVVACGAGSLLLPYLVKPTPTTSRTACLSRFWVGVAFELTKISMQNPLGLSRTVTIWSLWIHYLLKDGVAYPIQISLRSYLSYSSIRRSFLLPLHILTVKKRSCAARVMKWNGSKVDRNIGRVQGDYVGLNTGNGEKLSYCKADARPGSAWL